MAFDINELKWATDDITLPNAGVANKIAPSTAIQTNGYDKGQKPTASNFNYWRYKVYKALEDLDLRSGSATTLQDVYPIGSTYFNTTNSLNPSDPSLLGFGTWVRIGQGRVLIGEGTGTDDNGVQQAFPIGDTGGEYQHTLTTDEMPNHDHGGGTYWTTTSNEGSSVGPDYDPSDHDGTSSSVTSEGGGQAHNNVQPYLVVYMWSRSA